MEEWQQFSVETKYLFDDVCLAVRREVIMTKPT